MNITRKTFYGIGILSAALNILGGAMLLFSIRADLVFNIATVAAGVMMLMLATNLKEDPRGRNFCLAAALLTVLGMVPGIVGIVCAAASWPVFAWPYFKASVPENGLHKAAFLVMVCGLWAVFCPCRRCWPRASSLRWRRCRAFWLFCCIRRRDRAVRARADIFRRAPCIR